jgi:hypothetical protein
MYHVMLKCLVSSVLRYAEIMISHVLLYSEISGFSCITLC